MRACVCEDGHEPTGRKVGVPLGGAGRGGGGGGSVEAAIGASLGAAAAALEPGRVALKARCRHRCLAPIVHGGGADRRTPTR